MGYCWDISHIYYNVGYNVCIVCLQMISAERVMAYSKLDPEASLETTPPHQPPPADWPTKGELVLADVGFRYAENLPLVLKNLSFSIKPSEKVIHRQTE